MTLAEFVLAVERVTGHAARRTGRGYMARCPAHRDRTPSLAIAQGVRCILVHDHGGCRVETIVAALGLRMADLFEGGTPDTKSVIGLLRTPRQPSQDPDVLFLYSMSDSIRTLDRNGWALHGRVMERLLDEEIQDRATYQRQPGRPRFALLLAEALGDKLHRDGGLWAHKAELCAS